MTTQTPGPVAKPHRDAWPDDLLQRLAAGDSALWADVVRAFRPCLLARAAEVGLKPWQRQDLEQRVWLALFQHAGSIRDAACLPGWLSTTARRTALSLLREGRRELVVEQLPERPSTTHTDSDVERQCLDQLRLRELRSAIADLPARQRAVVRGLLRELSYDEVASLMGVALGSIGPTRQRALSRLRVALEAA